MARSICAALVAAAGVAIAANAQSHESYVSLSAGAVFPDDSDTSGIVATAFTTGEGGSIPAGTVLDAGTPVGWSTAFDTGYAVSGALGAGTRSGWRGELELAYASQDIDQHTGATLAGASIGAADAGVLFTGSPALGQTVDAYLAEDSGALRATYLMLNAYYDFKGVEWIVTPYLGGGIGVAFVDVDLEPQGATLAQDEDNVFAYQLIAGGSFAASERMEVFGQGRFRATDDIRARNAAEVGIPLVLELESAGFTLEGGVRFKF